MQSSDLDEARRQAADPTTDGEDLARIVAETYNKVRYEMKRDAAPFKAVRELALRNPSLPRNLYTELHEFNDRLHLVQNPGFDLLVLEDPGMLEILAFVEEKRLSHTPSINSLHDTNRMVGSVLVAALSAAPASRYLGALGEQSRRLSPTATADDVHRAFKAAEPPVERIDWRTYFYSYETGPHDALTAPWFLRLVIAHIEGDPSERLRAYGAVARVIADFGVPHTFVRPDLIP
ncbi:MAG: hypothetical protein IT477_10510 [Rhodanobacteraceae bacterium]|nr:hypothetical protein [Rhodanobacteraceae bacterium]